VFCQRDLGAMVSRPFRPGHRPRAILVAYPLPVPDDLPRLLLDPSAPLPTTWPTGALGAFLLFLLPVGGGIPMGVLLARDAGVPAILTAALYLVSDVVLAFTAEPMLALLRLAGRRVAFLGRLGNRLARLTGQAGLRDDGARGPLGLVLVSFAISPTTGRAAAAAAGHGFLSGWSLAILGDMGYFVLLMGSTLWLSGVFGDDRVTIGVVLGATWLLPLFLRRLRRPRRPAATAPGAPPALRATPTTTALLPAAPATRRARVATRRRGKRLHR